MTSGTLLADSTPPDTPGSTLDLRGSAPDLLPRIRRWIGAELADLGAEHLADVLLVANELATNAYEHGDGPLVLRMTRRRDPCLVRIEVEDANTRRPLVGRSTTSCGADRGRGMVLVDRITRSWGLRERPEAAGKAVWAEISCEPSPCSAERDRGRPA